MVSNAAKIDPELINDIVLEEIGHWLESENGEDSSHDEGEIFKGIILGKRYIQTEKDDSTTLSINGTSYKAELSFEEIKITVDEDASPTPIGLNIDNILGSTSDADSNSVDVQVNSIPDQDLGSIELSDGTKVEAGEVYTKAEAEGMTFEPSTDANGETDLELTIREG